MASGGIDGSVAVQGEMDRRGVEDEREKKWKEEEKRKLNEHDVGWRGSRKKKKMKRENII